jgi:hypothetical protein
MAARDIAIDCCLITSFFRAKENSQTSFTYKLSKFIRVYHKKGQNIAR